MTCDISVWLILGALVFGILLGAALGRFLTLLQIACEKTSNE